MEQRINALEKGQGALRAMLGLSTYLAKSSIEKNLLYLIEYRVSQINGCAYCLDMHSKDLRHFGETEQRIAAMALAEDFTLASQLAVELRYPEAVGVLVDGGHVPDRQPFAKRDRANVDVTTRQLVDHLRG